MLSRSEYTANIQLQSVAKHDSARSLELMLRPMLGQVRLTERERRARECPRLPVAYVLLCYILAALMLGLFVKYN